MGARANAMGGAGTALAEDFAATYYSPANLAYCRESSVSLALRHTAYELELRGTDPDDPELVELRDQTRATIGVCNRLPFGFALGIAFGVGLQNPMTLDQGTPDELPRFLLYGQPLEQLSIQLGLAYQIVPQVSVGIGASILVSSTLALDASIAAATPDATGSVRIRWDLAPTASLVAGVHVRPIPELRLALNYRSALFHDLDAPATIEVQVAGAFVDVPMLIESAAWYSPQQLAFGVTYTAFETLTFAFDLTWQDWSKHPGPFLVVTPNADDGRPTVVDGIFLREEFAFRDAVVPRFGVEYRMLDDRSLALRAGYGFRPAVAPLPTGYSNVLDSAVHSITLGGGYDFGDDPNSANPAPAGPFVRGANGRIGVFVRVGYMASQTVERPDRTLAMRPLDSFSFGGTVVDAGLELTLGWF
ncbi:MAG: hypothetical protein CMN30_09640 [Sandaracinus sp.]|nr:hypothetical protein [Sandaracinus sp.]